MKLLQNVLRAMNVLFINPEFPDSFWGFTHALPFEDKGAAFPPLGLLTVAAMLPSDWGKRVVDLNNSKQKLSSEDIAWADMVFVTGMLVQKKYIHAVIDRVRKQFIEDGTPDKKIVLGGPYITTEFDNLPDADIFFRGECEDTLPDFLNDLRLGIPQKFYEYDISDDSARPDMADSPVPDFALIRPADYASMSIQFSRGCPFRCKFCDIIVMYGNKPRQKTVAHVLQTLDAILATGYTGSVFLVDDNLIGNKKKVHELVPALEDWQEEHGFPFTFLTEASLNLADDRDLLAKMQRAGFRRVFLGIETPVEEALVGMQKGQNTKRSLKESVRIIQSYGLEVMGGFIIGNDEDPPDIFELQLEFIQATGIPLAMAGLLTALPKTPLWRELMEAGRLLEESSGSNAEGLNFEPVMDKDVLIEGYRWLVQKLYSPGVYYRRVFRCLWRLPKGVHDDNKYNLGEALTILKRVVREIGFAEERGRVAFWFYSALALLVFPRRIPQYVRFVVMGYHFRKLAFKTE